MLKDIIKGTVGLTLVKLLALDLYFGAVFLIEAYLRFFERIF